MRFQDFSNDDYTRVSILSYLINPVARFYLNLVKLFQTAAGPKEEENFEVVYGLHVPLG